MNDSTTRVARQYMTVKLSSTIDQRDALDRYRVATKKDGPFGYMLILDMYDCRPDSVDDLDLCAQFLEELVIRLDMHPQSPPFVFHSDNEKYPDKAGISGWIPLIESGIQIHTLKAKNFISLDVYSCGEFDKDEIKAFALAWFSPEHIEEKFMERGRAYYK